MSPFWMSIHLIMFEVFCCWCEKGASILLGVACLGILMSCKAPEGVMHTTQNGPEDLTLVKVGDRRLLVAGTAVRGRGNDKAGAVGRIEVLDLDEPAKGMIERYAQSQAASGNDRGFRPVGLDNTADPKKPGSRLLLVANGTGSVVTFKMDEQELKKHRETSHSDLLVGINGLTAARDGTIYVSTFGPRPRADCPRVGPPTSNKPTRNTVVMYHPRNRTWQVVAHGFAGANGLALSPDEDHLLVCSYYGQAVHAFERDPKSGLLKGNPIKVRSLSFFADNLKALGDGRYTVVGQQNFLFTSFHLALPKLRIASGGGECFTWQPGEQGRQLVNYSPILRKDRAAPSTVIPDGSTLYTGHIVHPGVGAWHLRETNHLKASK